MHPLDPLEAFPSGRGYRAHVPGTGAEQFVKLPTETLMFPKSEIIETDREKRLTFLDSCQEEPG